MHLCCSKSMHSSLKRARFLGDDFYFVFWSMLRFREAMKHSLNSFLKFLEPSIKNGNHTHFQLPNYALQSRVLKNWKSQENFCDRFYNFERIYSISFAKKKNPCSHIPRQNTYRQKRYNILSHSLLFWVMYFLMLLFG